MSSIVRFKKNRSGLRLLFYTAFITLLLWFFQSDFLITRIVLPLVANHYGYTLTVSNAGYSIFSNRFFVEDLTLTDDNGNRCTVFKGEARISFFRLLRGCFHINDITARRVRVEIVSLKPDTERSFSLEPERFHIGTVSMVSVAVFHGPWMLYLPRIQSSGTFENVRNTISCNGVYLDENHHLPIRITAQWNRRKHNWLERFTGSVESRLPGAGTFFNRELSDLRYRLLFSGQTTRKNMIHWRTTLECEGLGPTKDVLFRTNGYFDPAGRKGSFRGELKGHFSEAEIRKGLGIFVGSREVPVPENLTLQKFTGDFKFDYKSFAWDFDMVSSIDRLWFDGKEYLPRTKLHLANAGHFSWSSPTFHLTKLNMELQTASASLAIKNKKDFVFFRNDTGWHIDANNSQLLMDIKNIPASLINVWLPVKITDGLINGRYQIAADSRLQRLKGNLNLSGSQLAVALSDAPFVAPCNFKIAMDLESKGLENIQSLMIRRCVIGLENQEKKEILQANLHGEWNLEKFRMNLNGDMKIYTYTAAGAVYDPFIKELHSYLKRNRYEDVINHSKIRVQLDSGTDSAKNQLAFQLDTVLNSFIFLGKKYKDHPLNLSVCGKSSFSSKNVTVDFPAIRLFSKGLTDISATGNCSFPSGKAKFQLKLNSFTPEFWNSLAKITEWELDHMNYRSITGAVDFELAAQAKTLTIQNGVITMIPVDGTKIQVKQDRTVLTPWKNLNKTEIPLSMTIRNVPMSWWNCLLPYSTTFRFISGVANADLEGIAKNGGKDIYFHIDSRVKNSSLGVEDTVWKTGDCWIRGNFLFPEFFRDIEFHSLKISGYQNGKEYVSFLTDGFAGMETIRETALRFTIQKTTPEFLHLLSSSIPETKQFDMTGHFTYDADASYDTNRFTWDLTFKKILFRKEEQQKKLLPLKGNLKMEMFAYPNSITFRNAAVMLKDFSENTVADLRGHTIAKQNQNDPGITYKIQSSAFDLQYLLLLLTDHSSVPGTAEKMENRKDAEEKFSPAMLHGFIRKMKNKRFGIDLNNIMFTKHLNMALKGNVSFTEHGMKTDSVRWNVNQKGETDLYTDISILKNGDTAYNGKIFLRNISLVPFFDAFAVYTNKKLDALDGLSGEICESSLQFSGKGLSGKAMQENMYLDLQVKFKNLAIPPAAKDVSIILKILLFPLEQIPVLINKIRYEPAKLILQNIMGVHINVITGKQKLEFEEGTLELQGKNDHFVVKKMLFNGPSLRFDVLGGYVQPFRNKLFLDTMIRVGTMRYPLVFDCPLDNPDYNLNTTLQRWLIPALYSKEEKNGEK